ncbi:hypothetical protein BDP27DRAFT_1366398 [Rhodocollybia butyracea]|uniref:Plus3 domain-containing protein n=1 Tax=Rhodocollybia butyracea TaxID=206335 RepID=A0A9P5U3A3_9AGAR|nr:hypothetical protein BDP27DRAFT_1366398 [Rhodocollybia butyracea]
MDVEEEAEKVKHVPNNKSYSRAPREVLPNLDAVFLWNRMKSLEDELLSLVESPRKRKRNSKYTKNDSTMNDVDGLYNSEEDYEVLYQMNELEREMILSERAEKRQKVLDRRALSIIAREGAASISGCAPTPEPFEDGYKLPSSVPNPQPDGSPVREIESLLNAPTPEPSREANSLFSTSASRSAPLNQPLTDGNLTPEASLFDLERCRLSRRLILRFLKMSWFGEYIQGMWVRYPIGIGKYRILQVKALLRETVKPYQIDETTYNRKLELDVQIKIRVMAQLASNLKHIKHPTTKTFWRFEEWQRRVHSTRLEQLERAQEKNQHAEVLRLDELLTVFESKYGFDKFTSLNGKVKPTRSLKKLGNLPGAPNIGPTTKVLSMVSLEVDLGDF